MAKQANAITFQSKGKAGRQGKIQELNAAPVFQMPRMPLGRESGLHWNAYIEMADGAIQTYLNVLKPIDSLDERMAAAIGIPTEEWLGLSDTMKAREMKNITLDASPVPAVFTQPDITSAGTVLIFDKGSNSFDPKMKVGTDGTVDTGNLRAVVNAINAIKAHASATVNAKVNGGATASYTVNDHVPVDAILQSLGFLKLIPQIVIDKEDQNKKKLSHYSAEPGRFSDPQVLANGIRLIQSLNRAEAEKRKNAEHLPTTIENPDEPVIETDSKIIPDPAAATKK